MDPGEVRGFRAPDFGKVPGATGGPGVVVDARAVEGDAASDRELWAEPPATRTTTTPATRNARVRARRAGRRAESVKVMPASQRGGMLPGRIRFSIRRRNRQPRARLMFSRSPNTVLPRSIETPSPSAQPVAEVARVPGRVVLAQHRRGCRDQGRRHAGADRYAYSDFDTWSRWHRQVPQGRPS